MAARSVTIKVQNDFDTALVFDHESLQHGIWGSPPPPRIEAGTTAQWVAESDGVATGTEGTVWYRLDIPGTTGLVRLHWDNPYIGSNNFDQSGPDVLTVARTGSGSGNDATAHWVVADASTTGDGIPDSWKTSGATIDPGDGSGPQFVDLPAMGATVGKPDIFVHLDWMDDATHSHRPSDAAIRLVIDAFANAPYIARNGAVGINLHVDAGPTSILNPTNGATWGSLSRAASVGHVTQLGTTSPDAAGNINYDWTDFDKLKARAGGHLTSGRGPIFRYAVACHQIGSVGNSGVARHTPGSDFIVSLGTFAPPITDLNVAGTFMHELGHALGLDHGGSDGVNNKANYPSVMNYLWQMSGIRRGGAFVIDFSSVALAILNEVALNETVGLGPGSAGYGTSRWLPAAGATPAGFVQVADAAAPIDWDGDGLTTNINLSMDTNNDGSQTSLEPCNDWQILRLRGGAIGSGGYAPPTVSVLQPELTPQLQARILPPDTTPPSTTASVSPPPNGAGWNRTPVAVQLTATDDISGVARTEYRVDGVGPMTYSSPIALPSEGRHRVSFNSIDRSQNVEPEQRFAVDIDLTAPEVDIFYDPDLDDILVHGRDALSGVPAGPIAPTSRVDTEWTPFGSDTAELRVYEVRDRADNTTTLYLKVRCSPFAYEASVLALVYDDYRRAGRREQQVGRMVSPDGGSDEPRPRSERNTMVFERLVGRNAAHALLGVRQLVAIGDGASRRVVKARWDALDDYSIVVHESGTGSCAPCSPLPEHHPPVPDPAEGPPAHSTPVPEPAEGPPAHRITAPEPAEGSRAHRTPVPEPAEGSQLHSAETAASSRPRTDDCGFDDQPATDAAEEKPDPISCGPDKISERDVRGYVTLHIRSDDGHLHVDD
ncbi:OmpL47-type beta-barrel domain-containing protein [Microbacterium sp. NPDC055357]